MFLTCAKHGSFNINYIYPGVALLEKNAQLKLVRLGKKSSVHEDIHSLCLDNLVKKNLLQGIKVYSMLCADFMTVIIYLLF